MAPRLPHVLVLSRLRPTVQAGGGAIELTRRCRGAGSRTRRRLEPRLCRPLAQRRAVNTHLQYALTRRAWPARALNSLPGAVSTGRPVRLLTSSNPAHATVVLIRSDSDRRQAPRVDALVDCSYRRVCGCLNSMIRIPEKSILTTDHTDSTDGKETDRNGRLAGPEPPRSLTQSRNNDLEHHRNSCNVLSVVSVLSVVQTLQWSSISRKVQCRRLLDQSSRPRMTLWSPDPAEPGRPGRRARRPG